MFKEIVGPRLKPKVMGHYFLPSSTIEEIRLRANKCKWAECLESQKRSRHDQDAVSNLAWSDPIG